MRRIVTLLAVPLALSLAVPAPASAARRVDRDASHDMIRTDAHGRRHPAPSRSSGDIVEVRVIHAPTTVRVSVRYRDLARRGEKVIVVGVGTPRVFAGALVFHPTARQQHPEPTRTYWGSGEDWPCARATGRIDYRHARVLVQVPRRCLDKPHRVHVMSMIARLQPHGARIEDVASLDGRLPDVAAFGPWVPVG